MKILLLVVPLLLMGCASNNPPQVHQAPAKGLSAPGPAYPWHQIVLGWNAVPGYPTFIEHAYSMQAPGRYWSWFATVPDGVSNLTIVVTTQQEFFRLK